MTSRSTTRARVEQAGQAPRPLLIALALGIVYVVWGSTYPAIRVVVEDMPPLLPAGARFAAAAVLLAAALAVRYGPRHLAVSPRQLGGCAVVGLLLPAGGNGLVTLGESRDVPAGVAALLIASVPLWVIVLRSTTGDRPGARTVAGVLLGFAGLAGLTLTTGLSGTVSFGGSALILLAALSWSLGSWAQPRLPLPKEPFVMAVYEMLAGGIALMLAGAVAGESIHVSEYSTGSILAWAYLVVFGSIVAFTAYIWVLQHAAISLVATYAYVNPVVAVTLSWLVLSEPVTLPIAVAGAVVVGSVALVVSSERATA
ncbi:MAG TPA: EamA family transporter [Nocardioidaceae bacterium]|jgi:drug/metabolite transporter (DMT)-like permease|nr:EamA family transporter [Nocardioidaceae bacterium]